ncbi:allergin-1 [Pteronotus mesoamericanus]|uniref:allergin-1 n=1 Tax=Pteronotus mesoamericanus TaxID=1884717 RepID=UPI0023ED8DC6|nr:allergin-1 [Pteronotus parnellii mesoamericanus]
MMWGNSFFVLLCSLSTLKAELDCKTMENTNKLISPSLDSKTKTVMKGQNVSIICLNRNKFPQITYSLFRQKKCIGIQHNKSESVTFYLRISEADDVGPYKCKVQVCNSSIYSREFNFTWLEPVTSPVLNVTKQTKHYITLHCLSSSGSLPINYTFFENNITLSPVITKYEREPAELNVTKNTGGGQKYRCEAKNLLPDHVKYSQPVTILSAGEESCPFCLQLLLPVLLLVLIVAIPVLGFWIIPKYKARKAMRDKAPRDYGNTPMEDELYANTCENQADKGSAPGLDPGQCVSTARDEAEHSQEIHYVTPVFWEVKPQNHEACNDGKVEYIYSELLL